MKNKILSLLYTTAATLVLLTISSCSGIFSVPDTPDEQGTKAAQEQRYTISGNFSMPNTSAAPAEVTSFQNQANPRNAMPDTSITALKYIVKAVRTSDGQEESTESSDGKTYIFNNLAAGTWQITVYAYTKDSNAYLVMQSEPKSISLSAINPFASTSLLIAPSSGGTGDINLTISWDSANCGIGYCKMVCTSYTPLSAETTGSSVTKDLNGVPSGIHELKLSFYSSSENASAGMPPLYECTEYLSVLPHLTTNRWTAGSAPHINSSGDFNVTKTCTETFVYRKIYVAENGNDSGTGTSERPFATIKKAMDRLNEVATLNATKEAISATTPWELHVIGTPAKPTDTVSGEGLINATSSIQHLKIVGEGDGATIDANSKNRVLYVQSGANVTVENITLKNGRVSNGGSGAGIYVDTSGTFKMTSGELSGCTSTASAGGIYNKGTLTIENGTISGNSSTSQGGGIFADSGSLTISGGTISGNSTSSYGGGIYVNTGSVTITGGTIRSNTASDGANNVFISTSISTTIPAGNDSFYNEYSTANGKADAVCLSGSNFVRFNQPNDSGNSLASFSNLFTGSATIYLGQTDASSSEWKTSTLEIGADCNYNLTIRPTKTDANATIKYGSSSASNYYLIKFAKSEKKLTLINLTLDGNIQKCPIVYLSAGTLEATNCTFQNGKTDNGAGLFVSEGTTATLNSCTIQNCRAEGDSTYSKGGGIATKGTVNFNGGLIKQCTVKGNGGGVFVYDASNAKFNMTDGTIQSCGAEKMAANSSLGGQGGGVFDFKLFDMSGGTIKNCTAELHGAGVCILTDTTFNMSGNARVDNTNDVYLPTGCTINITDELTGATPAALITPSTYSENIQVVDTSSDALKSYYAKFIPSNSNAYYVDRNGTLQLGFSATPTSTGTEIYSLLQSKDDVMVYIPSGVTYKMVPNSSYANSGNFSGDGRNCALVIPSGKTVTLKGSGTLSLSAFSGDIIQIQGGILNLTDSVTINPSPKGNHWAAIELSSGGTLNMSGGTITGVHSGGGHGTVTVTTGCTFNMTGGSITGNTTACGGIDVSGGTFNMTGGSITNNKPTSGNNYAGGVTLSNGGTFTEGGGTISGNKNKSDQTANVMISNYGTYNGTAYGSSTSPVSNQIIY